jgi:hypothetical protein
MRLILITNRIYLALFPTEAIDSKYQRNIKLKANVNDDVYIRVTYTIPQPIDFMEKMLCYCIQQLTVNPLPEVNQAITDICQDATATPGTAVFDLN